MRASAHLAPDSAPASALHRAVMLARVRRARAAGTRGKALALALRGDLAAPLSAAEADALAAIERRRAEVPFEMSASGVEFGFGPPGDAEPAPDGEPPLAPDPAARLGAAWEVCRWSTIPPVWGRFLFRLVRELAPSNCVELGTGLGLSGAYQGTALALNQHGQLTSFDQHDAARIAERGFERLGLADRITLEFGDIDRTVPEAGPRLAPVDYALLDAEHSTAATVRHFELLLPYLSERAVLVFDDITQTDEMRQAWKTIISHRDVGFNLALRRYGGVFVNGPAGA